MSWTIVVNSVIKIEYKFFFFGKKIEYKLYCEIYNLSVSTFLKLPPRKKTVVIYNV